MDGRDLVRERHDLGERLSQVAVVRRDDMANELRSRHAAWIGCSLCTRVDRGLELAVDRELVLPGVCAGLVEPLLAVTAEVERESLKDSRRLGMVEYDLCEWLGGVEHDHHISIERAGRITGRSSTRAAR
jgi:hypothetical protein